MGRPLLPCCTIWPCRRANSKTQAESPGCSDRPHPVNKHRSCRAAIPLGLLSSSGGLHTLGGLFDKSCDSLGL